MARAAQSEAARDWDASLLEKMGMTHADAEQWTAARRFEEALEARKRIGDDGRTRVARSMVGSALRDLGRGQGPPVQTTPKAELRRSARRTPYVDEGLALLLDG